MKKIRFIIYIASVIFAFLFNFYFRPIKGNNLVTDEYRNSKEYVNDLYMSDEYFSKNLVNKNYEFIYKKIIESTFDDSAQIKIPCAGSEQCINNFTASIYALYLDHPELISYVGISGVKYEKGNLIYNNYEGLSKFKTYMATRRIEREMENIRKDTDGMDDKEKILYVYNYVASHNYDKLFTSLGSNQSAYSFFTKGSSVCAGFAKASQIIFQNIGIKSYLVINDSHLWNYVQYEGKYYVFDATVGASYRDKSNNRYYDGLSRTTVDSVIGHYSELYPPIETEHTLKELFGV